MLFNIVDKNHIFELCKVMWQQLVGEVVRVYFSGVKFPHDVAYQKLSKSVYFACSYSHCDI